MVRNARETRVRQTGPILNKSIEVARATSLAKRQALFAYVEPDDSDEQTQFRKRPGLSGDHLRPAESWRVRRVFESDTDEPASPAIVETGS